MRGAIIAWSVVLAALWSVRAPGDEVVGSPVATVAATSSRILDGDTLEADVLVWPALHVRTAIRVAGIDTPELLRSRCTAERTQALAARAALAALVPTGTAIFLRAPRADKYGGRVAAQVLLADGRDVGAVLIARGHARAYQGGPRGSWCASP